MRSFSRLRSIPVRIMGGFAMLLLLMVGLAAAILWAEGKVEAALAASTVAEANEATVTAAAERLRDTQSALGAYLLSGAASDRKALQDAAASFSQAVKPVSQIDATAASVQQANADLMPRLEAATNAASKRRESANKVLEVVKQTQNALAALAAVSVSDQATAEAITAMMAASLRPFSAISAFLASDSQLEKAAASTGLAGLRDSLASLRQTTADIPARVKRLAGTITDRLDETIQALAVVEAAAAARDADLKAMTASVTQTHAAMRAVTERSTEQRHSKQQEMAEARHGVTQTLIWGVLLGCLLGSACATVVGLSITKPLARLGATMRRLATAPRTQWCPTARGAMNSAVSLTLCRCSRPC